MNLQYEVRFTTPGLKTSKSVGPEFPCHKIKMKSYALLQDKGDIFSHKVQLYSTERTPMDDTRIPYGHKESVESTPYDFRESKVLTEEFLNSVGNDVMKVCLHPHHTPSFPGLAGTKSWNIYNAFSNGLFLIDFCLLISRLTAIFKSGRDTRHLHVHC